MAKLGDLIQFVQYLFNLDFKEAMQKINLDFNLNLKSDTKINYKKIQEIEERRNAKKRQYETLADKFKKLCKIKFDIKEKIENCQKDTTVYNWESQTLYISILQDKIGKIDMQLDEMLDKMNIIKNS